MCWWTEESNGNPAFSFPLDYFYILCPWTWAKKDAMMMMSSIKKCIKWCYAHRHTRFLSHRRYIKLQRRQQQQIIINHSFVVYWVNNISSYDGWMGLDWIGLDICVMWCILLLIRSIVWMNLKWISILLISINKL